MSSFLITGGTGSFGKALTKKLLSENNYNRIVIYSRDEHKQEQMEREIGKNDRMRYFIGDVRDKERLILGMAGCNVVVHAAAMKIVPTAEYNPMEAIKTNVIGAQNVIWASMVQRVPKVIALSTDKAVNPINLYGATKLCAEKLFLASNKLSTTKFSVVRYGNVANSNGSVIRVFKEQLNQGRPLTLTSEKMTRFWITLDEAVNFVLKSLDQMNGGETFIPEMPSFKVIDLAKAMSDTPIEYIGIRPGEKLHEAISEGITSDSNILWLGVEELKTELRRLGV